MPAQFACMPAPSTFRAVSPALKLTGSAARPKFGGWTSRQRTNPCKKAPPPLALGSNLADNSSARAHTVASAAMRAFTRPKRAQCSGSPCRSGSG